MSFVEPPDASSNSADLSASAQGSESPTSKQSRIISTVLSPAVRLWLRSQLEQADDLHVTIEAGDRQLLSGSISRVSVSAQKAVYRGIVLSQAQVVGERIRTNLRQLLRGKPLRLLEAFPVSGEIQLNEADVNASLRSPLLANAVIEFLLTLLESELEGPEDEEIKLRDPQVLLGPERVTLIATLESDHNNPTPVVVRTGFQIENGNELKLDRPQWLPHANAQRGLALNDLHGFTFHLGPHVDIQKLLLEAGRVVCQGQIMVTPEES